jgi:hypothetical protein
MKYVLSSLVALGLVASGLGSAQALDRQEFACRIEDGAKKGVTEVAPGLLVGGGLWLLESHHWILPTTAQRLKAKWDKAEVRQKWVEVGRRLFGRDHSSATASCARE